MKQVLVIEDEEKFWNDYTEQVVQTGSLTNTEFLEKYSPGALLAEFEGKIEHYPMITPPPCKVKQLTQVTLPEEIAPQFQKGQPVTVLILARTDTGSGVKK